MLLFVVTFIGCWACGNTMNLKIVPPGFELPPVYNTPSLTANTVYAEAVVPAPPTSSGRVPSLFCSFW